MKPIKLSTVPTGEARLANWTRGLRRQGEAGRARAYWIARAVFAERNGENL